jgi:DNA repair ATPase RecN
MTKGNLNDLIREEVQKEVDTESSTVTDPKGQRETHATLQAKINELTIALNLAEETSRRLQEQMSFLETALQSQTERNEPLQSLPTLLAEQTTLVENLSSQLQRSTAELETQKQLVEKLYHHIQTLENRPSPAPEPPPKTVAKPLSLYNFEARTLARYVAPASAPTELTNADIGWFD